MMRYKHSHLDGTKCSFVIFEQTDNVLSYTNYSMSLQYVDQFVFFYISNIPLWV